MIQCKRLSDCPAERLAQCRGAPVPPAGDVEVLACLTSGGRSLYFPSENIDWREGDIELIDRAHVTRLTAELESERCEHAETERISQQEELRANDYATQLVAAQSELTKARELLMDVYMQNELSIYDDQRIDKFLNPPTPTPIAHNVDESCEQDAEAAKGGA